MTGNLIIYSYTHYSSYTLYITTEIGMSAPINVCTTEVDYDLSALIKELYISAY